jgi:5-methylcytosine-specific restriction endonuclease McrA
MRTPEQRRAEYLRTREACLARAKRRYAERHEEILARLRKRYASDPEFRVACRATRNKRKRSSGQRQAEYLRRRDKALAAARKYRQDHPGYNTETMRRWNDAHPGSRRDRVRRWQRLNRSRHLLLMRIREGRRRARMEIGKITPDDIRRLLWFQGGRCHYCGRALGKKFHVEHMTPLVRGGAHARENVCLACAECNRRKHTKTADEFLTELSRAALAG